MPCLLLLLSKPSLKLPLVLVACSCILPAVIDLIRQYLIRWIKRSLSQHAVRARKWGTKLASLQEELLHPCSEEKARLWLPNARRAQELTMQLTDYFARQRKAFGSDNDGHGVKGLVDSAYHRVQVYWYAILSLREEINHEFKASFEGLNTPGKAQSAISEQLQLLRDADERQLPVLLTQLQHSIMQFGASVVAFCGAHVGCFIDRFDTNSAIIGQSSQGVLPGDSVEIFAGVGLFPRPRSQ